MNAILERRSIRKYTGEKVSDALMEDLLRAAMAAPSGGNEQPWEFVVVRDQKLREKITRIHPYSQMLPGADAAILVCGDVSKEKFKGLWVQDCAAATENILITAQEKGLGAVWLGVYPEKDRMDGLKELLGLPDTVYPFSIVSVGYPAEHKEPADRFDKARIHHDKW